MVVRSPDAGSTVLPSELSRSLPPPVPVTPTIAATISAYHHLVVVLSVYLAATHFLSSPASPTLLFLLLIAVLYGLLVFCFPTLLLAAANLLHSLSMLLGLVDKVPCHGVEHLLGN
jgi:hypothetical protein